MKKTIVIVEDNDLLRKLLICSLEVAGYNLKDFANAQGAISYMKENQSDLLITDIHMPVMDGLELIQRVRKDISKTIPIVVISSECDEDFKLNAFKLGVDDYVTKPFFANELRAHIKHLISDKKPHEYECK